MTTKTTISTILKEAIAELAQKPYNTMTVHCLIASCAYLLSLHVEIEFDHFDVHAMYAGIAEQKAERERVSKAATRKARREAALNRP